MGLLFSGNTLRKYGPLCMIPYPCVAPTWDEMCPRYKRLVAYLRNNWRNDYVGAVEAQ